MTGLGSFCRWSWMATRARGRRRPPGRGRLVADRVVGVGRDAEGGVEPVEDRHGVPLVGEVGVGVVPVAMVLVVRGVGVVVGPGPHLGWSAVRWAAAWRWVQSSGSSSWGVSAASWRWARVGWLPIQELLPAGGRGGAGSAWRRHAPTPRTTPQPAGWPAVGVALTSLPWFARRPLEQAGSARGGCVRGWGLAWAAGVGQADLAAGVEGPVGLAEFLGEETAAFGRLEQSLVDLAVVEGAGGDQVVEVAGRFPQLPVAVADRSGGNPGQLLGQGRPRIAVCQVGAWGRKLHRARGSLRRSAF
jgi:hypothetical protein